MTHGRVMVDRSSGTHTGGCTPTPTPMQACMVVQLRGRRRMRRLHVGRSLVGARAPCGMHIWCTVVAVQQPLLRRTGRACMADRLGLIHCPLMFSTKLPLRCHRKRAAWVRALARSGPGPCRSLPGWLCLPTHPRSGGVPCAGRGVLTLAHCTWWRMLLGHARGRAGARYGGWRCGAAYRQRVCGTCILYASHGRLSGRRGGEERRDVVVGAHARTARRGSLWPH